MNPQQDRSIIPIPSQELTGPQIVGNRILGQMVDEVLALGRAEADVEIPRFKIGEYVWCEAEYRQILFWAEALSDTPSSIIERLIAGKKSGNAPTHFQEGRIFSLAWGADWLPIRALANLALPNLTDLSCFYGNLTEIDLSSVPNLTRLYCSYNHLMMIDFSRVPNLALFDCSVNTQLTQLDLSKTPKLSKLICEHTRFTKLDLSHTPNLCDLHASGSEIAELDLSLVPNLRSLDCSDTLIENLGLQNLARLTELRCNYCRSLTSLDLSGVPNLTNLDCSENYLSVLDIRPLRNLIELKYDSDKTRLIQRPDQNFKR